MKKLIIAVVLIIIVISLLFVWLKVIKPNISLSSVDYVHKKLEYRLAVNGQSTTGTHVYDDNVNIYMPTKDGKYIFYAKNHYGSNAYTDFAILEAKTKAVLFGKRIDWKFEIESKITLVSAI